VPYATGYEQTTNRFLAVPHLYENSPGMPDNPTQDPPSTPRVPDLGSAAEVPSATAFTASDEEIGLVAALRAGDERAFMTLIDRYQSSLIRLALLYVGDRGAAEDVVQETWLGVLQGIDRFEARSSLKTWLFRILTNRAKRRGERDHRTIPFAAAAPSGDDGEPSVDPDRFFPTGHQWAGHWSSLPQNWDDLPEDRLLSAETRAVVDRAIASLSPTQREVITLRDVEGWASEDVRNALDLSETNQRVLLHRARTKVRRALEEHLGR
jgi:RNA polymerase sigma-70 factor (ECF subfamily)